MKIWAHTVFKNEERWLWFSVTSVIDHVDKLLLWDTGSTDRSWEIATILKEKYKDKIEIKKCDEVTPQTFPIIRQQMLDQTNADWFIVVDGDEVWWEDSIKKLVDVIKNNKDQNIESVVVPNINLVGDIYHSLPNSAGNYTFGDIKGNYALRAIKKIDGLKSLGNHGVWGWADGNNQQIQERKTFKFVDAPYIHTTFLPRGENRDFDLKVPKRAKKLKYEIGNEFPKDFYYPESFFKDRPDFIPSPWEVMSTKYRLISSLLTPVKKMKRRVTKSGVGY